MELLVRKYIQGDYENFIQNLSKTHMKKYFEKHFGGWSDDANKKQFYNILKNGNVYLFYVNSNDYFNNNKTTQANNHSQNANLTTKNQTTKRINQDIETTNTIIDNQTNITTNQTANSANNHTQNANLTTKNQTTKHTTNHTNKDAQNIANQTIEHTNINYENNQNLIGFTTFIEEKNNKNKYVLNDIHIKDEFQNKGFGSKILLFVENKIKELDGKQLKILVFEDNSALKFYERNNYKKIGFLKKNATQILIKEFI